MGDNTNTTTTGSADPMVKQTLDQLLGGVQSIWKQGVPTYNHSLYSPAGPTTQNAWAQGAGNARSLLQGGGLDTMQRQADSALSGIGRDYGNLGDHNGLTTAQQGAMSGANALGGQYAGLAGAYGQDTPGYANLRSNAANDALSSINGVFNNSGRFGGGSNAKAAGEGVTNALSGLDYANYQNNVNNQYRSLDSQQGVYGNVFNMGQQGVGNQFNALAGRTGIQDQLFNNGQTAIGNQNNALATLGGVGAAQDANRQGILTGNANLFNAQHGNRLALLQQLLGGFSGAAPAGGSQTTSPGVPWWQQIAGLGIAGLGALG